MQVVNGHVMDGLREAAYWRLMMEDGQTEGMIGGKRLKEV